ncbi:MAG: hypothetical protein CEO22_54 [Candidatus Berkelbacteria bacterium Gr01-1014_85]|uniref:PEGA domain-containing protein n=1 Tax=Candidatus Berkelbacteria bacterium Gr01-1014_85 TaxID=2017150 RepID=A0A554JDS1_9BACT|nr:MAG: hypothetical protein CEO22_54 [Candidatus Berkelbacteria bacterium Gr01-1014_85]
MNSVADQPVSSRRHRERLILLMTLAIGSALLAALVYWRFFLSAHLILNVEPASAIVSIDGQPTGDRQLWLSPGQYQFQAEATGFASQAFTLSLKSGEMINKTIQLVSLPQAQAIDSGQSRWLTLSQVGPALWRLNSSDTDGFDRIVRRSGEEQLIASRPLATKPSLFRLGPNPELALLIENNRLGVYDFNRYDLINQEYRQLTAGDQSVTQAVWSQVDSRIFYLLNLTTGWQLRQILPSGEDDRLIFEWSKDAFKEITLVGQRDRYLYLELVAQSANGSVNDQSLARLDIAEKVLFPLTTSGRATAGRLNNSGQIAYLDNGELTLMQVDGEAKLGTDQRPSATSFAWSENDQLISYTPGEFWRLNPSADQATVISVALTAPRLEELVSFDGRSVFYLLNQKLYQLDLGR